jgi:hypothetical protein
MHEIEDYETERKEFKADQSQQPILGCFEVLGKVSKGSGMPFSVDSEEERTIMKCFAVCKKKEEVEKKQEPSKIPTLNPHIPKCVKRLKHVGMQTSLMKIVEGGSDDSVQASKSLSKDFCSVFSQDCYANDDYDDERGSTANSESMSVLEIYKNNKLVDDSETAHYTSLTVSPYGASPPESPPKKVASTAQRVKFTSFYDGLHKIPAQTEPMMTFEIQSSSSTESLPSDIARKLPRFPVRCPISNCSSFNVPSDFCNHITIDHPHVAVMRVLPGKLINMNVNHKANAGLVVCQRLFLLSEKIK